MKMVVKSVLMSAGLLPLVLAACCSEAAACHRRRCVVVPACVVLYPCSPIIDGCPMSPVPPDEEELGTDLPKPGPLPEIPKVPPLDRIRGSMTSSETAEAQIVIALPVGAKLFLDDHETQQTLSERIFVTPPLPRGKEYAYEARAEWVESGFTITQRRQITVQAGQVSRVNFLDQAGPDVAQVAAGR